MKKKLIYMALCVVCTVLLSSCVGSGENAEQEKALETQKNQLKKAPIMSTFEQLIYGSETRAIVVSYAGIFVYDFNEKKLISIFSFSNNEELGDVTFAGEDARYVISNDEGTKVYIMSSVEEGKSFEYDIDSGQLLPFVKKQPSKTFDSFEEILANQLLEGKNSKYYLSDESACAFGGAKGQLDTSSKGIVYLINRDFKTLGGLTLVKWYQGKFTEYPLWD